jgi:hypothetical protein
MAQPQILGGETKKGARAVLAPSAEEAWRWISWFSLALLVAGLGDTILALVPLRFGNIEWEFGTIAATFAGLPLVTMGFAGALAAAIARGRRLAVLLLAWLVLLWGALVLAGLVLFLTDVPAALRAVGGDAQLGIRKAAAKTGMLGIVFATVYFATGIGSLRRLRRAGRDRV